MFASPADAQAQLDAWVSACNNDRPHQGIAMATPAQRFSARPCPAGQPLPGRPARREGGEWVTRKVGANGVISIGWQQFSVGKHRAGEVVDVHLTGELAQVWHHDELLKTIVRTDTKEVRKKRAARARQDDNN